MAPKGIVDPSKTVADEASGPLQLEVNGLEESTAPEGINRETSSVLHPSSNEGRRGAEEVCAPHTSEQSEQCPPITKKAMDKDCSRCPPCIAGQVIGTAPHDHLVLRSLPLEGPPGVDISAIPDLLLADHLCRKRAIFTYYHSENDYSMVECLIPLRKVVNSYPFQQELLVTRLFSDEGAPLSVMQMALVRDCLMGSDRERLIDACERPSWAVPSKEYYAGHCLIYSGNGRSSPGWKMKFGALSGQMELSGLVQYISQRRHCEVQRPVIISYPWQTDPPLPSSITIDVSNHHPKSLPAPDGWEIIQRNGRVWIVENSNRVSRMDAAQYGMLLATCCGHDTAPSTQFLQHIAQSCRAQQDADVRHCVPWSRHFLASIRQVTGTELVIGASAVTYNPHFPYFYSPLPSDAFMGSVSEWPQVPALLILDSFVPLMRAQLLDQAAHHRPGIWILRQNTGHPDDPDLAILWKIARVYAELPKKSRVLHKQGYWETAAWDVKPSSHISQLWRVDTQQQDPQLHPTMVQQYLSRGGPHRYAFHWWEDSVPPQLLLHRQHQQDALRHNWDDLVAGTDGSVDERAELMGAGYVLGDDPVPTLTFHARVGGPLASARAEAASLLQLLKDVRLRYIRQVHLLIFVDCLVILDILRKWGRSDYHPGPKEIIHFTVLRPLLEELRQWRGTVTLVKVKSHTGCLLNELADEQAELGRANEGSEICPGPQKYGSFWLRVRPTAREHAEKCGVQLPRDSAPNRSLLERVAASNTLRAVKKRRTPFVIDLLQHKEGATVSKIIQRCTPAEYRVWLRCMTGIYPVQTYLRRIGVSKSPTCLHCGERVPETLTHFACVCPKFREARTSAHNQVRAVITSFLHSILGPEWELLEETRIARTGLTLRSTPQATIDQLGRRQPDWVAISAVHKRIAIIDLCRPSDVHPAQLLAAAMRKQHAYNPLKEALSEYTDQGWVVHVFPWVVGIRGLIDPLHLESALKFLDVQRKSWRRAVERTVLASVRAFHFLHKIRYGGLLETGVPHPNVELGASASDEDERNEEGKRKLLGQWADPAPDSSDTDSGVDVTRTTAPRPSRRRRKTLVGTSDRLPLASNLSAPVSLQPSSLDRPTSARPRVRVRGTVPKRSTRHGDRARARKLPIVQPVLRGKALLSGNKTRLSQKRTRCWHASSACVFDTDDPNQRSNKQPRHESTDHAETLWNRWRQLEPRGRGRT